jgi:hypothetical protein
MFGEFRAHVEQLMIELIADLNMSLDHRKHKVKLLKNNLAYFEVEDVEVKLALMTLQDEDERGERVSDKLAVRLLRSEFKDYLALYEYLGDNLQLRVPLVSLCEYQGFLALFKILSHNQPKLIRQKELHS